VSAPPGPINRARRNGNGVWPRPHDGDRAFFVAAIQSKEIRTLLLLLYYMINSRFDAGSARGFVEPLHCSGFFESIN
jgi:hypothetical protein